MSQKAPAAPPAPDPVATAQAQSEYNIQAAETTARLNRVNQNTPQGSSTWRQTGPRNWNEAAYIAANPDVAAAGMNGLQHYRDFGIKEGRMGGVDPNFVDGGWEQNTTFSPEQQRLYDTTVTGQQLYGDAAVSQLRSVQDRLSQPFQFNGPEVQYRPDFTGIGDPDQSRASVEQALLSRINPDLERERAGLEARLAAQGITMGSEQYNTGMQDYARMANDARFGAIREGGAEQSRMFGLGFGQTQLGNAARGQSLQEQLALRAQPLNEAAALLSGEQVQMPQFGAVPQVSVAAPDYQGAVGQNYAGQMQQWNANSQRVGANNAAMAQLAGQVGGFALGGGLGFTPAGLAKRLF